MTAAHEAILQLRKMLPTDVAYVEWQDPALIIRGNGWGMTVLTAWRITFHNKFLVGSDSADPSIVVKLLDKNTVIKCEQQSLITQLDPTLVFASGHALEVFSLNPLEPWMMSFTEIGLFVASPSE